ncbi:MAG: M48 family metalloprotease, partial [Armatimonadetes bacterium]|nr:M48 family metalloprotease [Armatimonadota bacterium]
MARRGKALARRGGKQRLYLRPADFRYPGESRLYWQGVGGVMLVFVWLAALLFFIARTPSGGHRWDLVAETLAWPAVSVLICNILSVRPRAKEFKRRDRQSRVMSTNYPQWHRVLQDFQRLCGLKRTPEMYILPEERAFIFSMPARGGTIVASRGLLEKVSPAEFTVLMAHEMGHILCHHVRAELAIVYIRGANPVWQIILLPVTL